MDRIHLALIMLLLLAGPIDAADTYRVSDSQGFNRAAASAQPGDQILLAPGEYGNNFDFKNVRGTAGQPIVIAAANPNRPPRLAGKYTPLHLSGVSHIEVRDLIITGCQDNGLNIDDGGNLDKPSHHVTLKNISVKNIGPNGNVDGIKLSGVDDFLLENCTFERWGSSGSAIDMVGCHRGVVVGCSFRNGGDNAVQAKGGSSDVTVRKCRFLDAGDRAVNIGGITANDAFRPRFTSFPANARFEAKDIRVEGCTFIGGEAAVAFVGVDGAAVRYNTIYHPKKYAVRILQERPTKDGFVPSRNGVFENNVVVFRSDNWADGGINIGPDTAPKTFRFNSNLWYCEDQPGRSEPKLPSPEVNGLVGKDPGFRDPAAGDLSVGADSPARGRGAHALPETGRGE